MNFLVVDFIYYVLAHRIMNCDYINALSKVGRVTVLAIEGFYKSNMLATDVELIEIPYIGEARNGFGRIRDALYVTKETSKLDEERNFDIIFALTYDTRAMAIGRFYFKNLKKIYLMNHYNIDANEKLSHYIFYNTYKNKIKQFVLEPSFMEVLVSKYNVRRENIFYIPHKAHILEGGNGKVKYDCVGISNSNDDDMIRDIVEIEKKEGVFAGRKVILKSKEFTYEDDNLKVINKYVTDEEYADYINSAKQIFMPFPSDFKYRLSGTLYEALAAKKKVITTDIFLARDFSKRYPECCTIVSSARGFISTIMNYDECAIHEESYDIFIKEHSEEKIVEVLFKMFCNKNVDNNI